MILCHRCTDEQPLPIHWTDCVFVLVATCTVTVAAFLNFGLSLSIWVGGVARRHPVTLQLCVCGLIACAALSCRVQQVWDRDRSSRPPPPHHPAAACDALGQAALFSHCAFLTLASAEPRLARRACVFRSLALVVAWCATSAVTCAASVHCTPATALLVFCLYALHVPLVALVAASQLRPRSVSPSEVAPRGPEVRRVLPQALLFFVGTMPQAFVSAVGAFDWKPPRSADAWCSLLTAVFAALRPLMDATMRPELGKASVDLIGYLCRRKVLNRSIAE